MISEDEENALTAISDVVDSLPPEQAALMLFSALIALLQLYGIRPIEQIRKMCSAWEEEYGDSTELPVRGTIN